ncbi:MAG: tetratricopeptide repeat protein [Acidobacteria bacterium]|nr:MAG: tetratricopeptide repeat protein [Acidobacteriota bacterium]
MIFVTGCAPKTRPNVAPPAVWRVPTVPAELATAAPRVRYDEAWARVQRGDVGGGERVFEDINRRTPAFYPAVASLGELRLHRQQYSAAAALFERALLANPSYLPALSGAADAHLGAGDDAGALRALTALVAADPTRADAVARLDGVRVRVAQSELVLAERDKADGKFPDAALHLQRAMDVTPENAAVFRAASSLELAMGRPGVAEQRARQALAIDPRDAGAYAALGDALEGQGRLADATAAFDRAISLDPRPQWRDRRDALSASAQLTALPSQYRAIAQASAVTRADVAAMLGVQLAGALSHAPDRSSTVVTDVRGHWAANWILPVVRAGWIDALPNHTFQPGGVVHRAELAAIVAAVLADVAAARPRDIARWRSARPVFADVTRDHAAYGVVAIAVASGAMSTDAGRFSPGRTVSGAELVATIARLEQMQR